MKQIITILLAGIATIFMTACGGGGGDSSTPTTDISFPSDSVLAAPTPENALKVRDVVTINQLDTIPPVLNSVNENSKINPALLSGNLAQEIVNRVNNIDIETYSLNEVINETEACHVSGTISISGEGDEINGGYLTFTFSNCNDGETISNGSVYLSISNYDSSVDDFRDYVMKITTDFTVTLLSDSSYSKIVQGSYLNIYVSAFDIYGNLEAFNVSTSMQATNGTEIYGIENGVFYYSIIGDSIAYYQTQGRIYIDNLAAYVDYDTTYDMSLTPFRFSGTWIYSGTAIYNMDDGGKVKIEIVTGTIYTYLDSDGDGNYELIDTSIS